MPSSYSARLLRELPRVFLTGQCLPAGPLWDFGKEVARVPRLDSSWTPERRFGRTTVRKSLRNLVGPPRFELGTSCTPSKRASQAAPRPDPDRKATQSIFAALQFGVRGECLLSFSESITESKPEAHRSLQRSAVRRFAGWATVRCPGCRCRASGSASRWIGRIPALLRNFTGSAKLAWFRTLKASSRS